MASTKVRGTHGAGQTFHLAPNATRRRLLRAGAAAVLLPATQAVAAAPPRVIAVGGALTEIVFRLGAQGFLVATDTTSTFPAAAETLPKVGYARTLSAEGLLALRPTLLVASAEAGPPAALEQLHSAGVRMLRASGAHTFEALVGNVELVAGGLDVAGPGAALRRELDAAWKATLAGVVTRNPAPRVMFVLSHAATSVQVAGEGTAADAMIRLAGGRNALSGFQGYRPLSSEAAIAAAPDVILATREGITALGGVDALLGRPGLALTPSGKTKRVLAPDALYLLGFGPRLPDAVRELAQGLATWR